MLFFKKSSKVANSVLLIFERIISKPRFWGIYYFNITNYSESYYNFLCKKNLLKSSPLKNLLKITKNLYIFIKVE